MHWKHNYVIKSEENSDYYYLSNRKMIEAVFSSRVSLLAFYFQESFTAHKKVLWLKRRIKLVKKYSLIKKKAGFNSARRKKAKFTHK